MQSLYDCNRRNFMSYSDFLNLLVTGNYIKYFNTIESNINNGKIKFEVESSILKLFENELSFCQELLILREELQTNFVEYNNLSLFTEIDKNKNGFFEKNK